MGRTLGINDDYWHGIIPAVLLTFLIPVALISFDLKTAFILLLVAVLDLFLLQFWNEWNQAVSVDVVKKYGSFENFQANSRKDTKLFVIGVFIGIFLGFVSYGALYNIVH